MTYTITPALVLGTYQGAAIASESVTAGQVVGINVTTRQAFLAVNSSAALANATGIALNSAGIGQPVIYQTSGAVDLASTHAPGDAVFVTYGQPLLLSGTPGKFCDAQDITVPADIFVTIIGYAVDAYHLQIGIVATGLEYHTI